MPRFFIASNKIDILCLVCSSFTQVYMYISRTTVSLGIYILLNKGNSKVLHGTHRIPRIATLYHYNDKSIFHHKKKGTGN